MTLRVLFTALLLMITSASYAGGHGVMIDDAWIREAPPAATSLAGYMKVMNHSDKDMALVGASSTPFGKVMLHRTVMEDGMAKMKHQMRIAIPAGKGVTFEPNGYHIMLMKPKQTLKAGDMVDVTLEFEGGMQKTVTFHVRKSDGGMGMMMDHSQH